MAYQGAHTGLQVDTSVAAAEAFHVTMDVAEAVDLFGGTKTITLSGRSVAGDCGTSALFKRVDSEPSHTAKFRSADRYISDGTESASNGGWWEKVIDGDGIVVPWYGPCDTDANRRSTTSAAYTHWATLNSTAYGDQDPNADACKLYFPNIQGLDFFDLGSPLSITTVGSFNEFQGPGSGMFLRNIQFVFEDKYFQWHGFQVDGDVGATEDDYLDVVTLGTDNGRADMFSIRDYLLYRCGVCFKAQDVAGGYIGPGVIRKCKQSLTLASQDVGTNPQASGDLLIDHQVCWNLIDYGYEIKGTGEVKMNGVSCFDSNKPNILIRGSGSERAIQMYFTDCTFTIGNDGLTDRSSTTITSITDNGSGDVRINYASGSFPYIFEGMRRLEIEFDSVYDTGDLPGDWHITNVTSSSFDIPGMSYISDATGTVWHCGWNIVVDSDSSDDSGYVKTDTYDIHFVQTKCNSVFIGKADNVNWIGSAVGPQIYVSEDCLGFTHIGSTLWRVGEKGVDSYSLPISGPGKWASISNLRDADGNFGAVIETPASDAEYDTAGKFNLPSKVNGFEVTDAGVKIKGENLSTPTLSRSSAYLSSTAANVIGNDGTFYTIVFDTELYDVGGNYNASTGEFTAPFAGLYEVKAAVGFNQITGADYIRARIKTTDQNFDTYKEVPGSFDRDIITLAQDVVLDASDTIIIQAACSGLGGDTADVIGSDPTVSSFFTVRRVG